VVQGSTQPPTEMSIRNLPGSRGCEARKADNLTAICELIVYKMWKPRYLTILWASMTYYKDSFISFLSSFLTDHGFFLRREITRFSLPPPNHKNFTSFPVIPLDDDPSFTVSYCAACLITSINLSPYSLSS
jgi:hypothetical protein